MNARHEENTEYLNAPSNAHGNIFHDAANQHTDGGHMKNISVNFKQQTTTFKQNGMWGIARVSSVNYNEDNPNDRQPPPPPPPPPPASEAQ